MNNEQFKITHYNIPLFLNCYKAYSTCSSYIIFDYQHTCQQLYNSIQSKFICPIIVNQNKQITMIQMEGQCLHKFVLSKKNQLDDPIMSQEEIWILIVSISSAFMVLKENGLAHKLTHLRQYCVRKIDTMPRFKLIFHESIISQLQAGQQGLCKWDDLYLSPQQLRQNFITQKSIVFSLGVMVMNICANCDRDRSIYKLNAYQVDGERIRFKNNLMRNKYGYSKALSHLLQKCLKFNHQQRFDFGELWSYIDNLIKKKSMKCWNILNEIIQRKSKQNSQSQPLIKAQEQIKKRLKLYNILKRGRNQSKQKLTNHRQDQIKIQMGTNKQMQKHQQQEEFSTKIMRLGNQYNHNLQHGSQNDENQFLEQSPNPVYTPNAKYISEYRGTFGGNRQLQIQKQQERKQQNLDAIRNISKVRSINESKLDQADFQQDQIREPKNPIIKQGQNQRNLCSEINKKIEWNKLQKKDFETQQRKQNQKQQQKLQYTAQHQSSKQKNQKQYQKYTIPQLVKELKYLKLELCLTPVQQIAKSFTSIGIWIEGDVYYGDYSHGTRNGLSLQLYSNGEYYYGFFKDDLYHGEGFYFWNELQYFFGQFNEGQKVWGRLEGQIKYQGNFKNNKRHGEGTCWYSTGQVYSGNWQNGKRDGQGFILQPSGTKFVGHWVRGNRRGEGYLQMERLRIAGFWNGETIQGQSLIEYSNGDMFRGKIGPSLEKLNGEYFSKSGTIFKGYFENDQPSQGLLKYSNGDKYYGQLYKMKRHGYGEYYYTNGLIYKGNWENNLKVTDQT